MPLANLLDLSALVLGLYSAVFFAIGVLTIKKATLEIVAVSMWEKGATLAKELAQQKADFACGGFLLLLSFSLQFFSKAFMDELGSVAFHDRLAGAAAAFGVATAVLFVCLAPWWFYRQSLVNSLKKVVAEKG